VIPKEKLETYLLVNLRQFLICLGKTYHPGKNSGVRDQLTEAASELRKSSGGYNLRFMIAATFLLLLSLTWLFALRFKFALEHKQILHLPELIFMLVYIVLQSSSSFIEEEHEFWYFSLTSLIVVKCLFFGSAKSLLPTAVTLVLARIPRNWNSVGNQALQVPDMKAWIQPKTSLANVVILLSLIYGIWNFSKANRLNNLGKVPCVFVLAASASIFAFKCGYFQDEQYMARLSYGGIFVVFASQVYQSLKSLQLTFYLLFIFLLKPHNAPVLAVILALSNYLSEFDDDGFLASALRIAFMHFSYFALGPSNLIVSLDFSNAFIGFSSFNFPLVSLITFLMTWSGPILASYLLLAHVKYCIHRSENLVILDVAIWKAFVTISLLISLIIQRHHLFVWSVFAPRLLFEFGWFIFYSLVFIAISIIN
jgi:ethanolaminephosphotransferase